MTPASCPRASLRAARLAVIYVVAIATFVAAMTAVFALPQGRIMKHLRASVQLLRQEGLHPRPVLAKGLEVYELDNFTDALMLDTSLVTTKGGALYAAMADVHGNDSSARGLGFANTINVLQATASGKRYDPEPYAYYWHGYQLALRPLLVLTDYSGVRYLNILLLSGLAFLAVAALFECGGRLLAGMFMLSLAAAGAYLVPLSLQFSGVFYITLLATLAVVELSRRDLLRLWHLELFFFVGMLTSFVDLLTAPLLTLAMPLAVALVLLARKERLRAGGGVLALGLSTGWAVGYAVSWVTKWLLASAVLRADVVHQAVGQLLLRAGRQDAQPLHMRAVVENLRKLLPLTLGGSPGASSVRAALPELAVALVLAAGLVSLLVSCRKPREELARVLPVLWVAPLPYLWMLAASNHSAIHAWFTYRIQAATLFALGYALLGSIDFDRLRLRLGLVVRSVGSNEELGLLGGGIAAQEEIDEAG